MLTQTITLHAGLLPFTPPTHTLIFRLDPLASNYMYRPVSICIILLFEHRMPCLKFRLKTKADRDKLRINIACGVRSTDWFLEERKQKGKCEG